MFTANLLLDDTVAASSPGWILRFDLSKTFVRVDSGTPWLGFSEHGMPNPMFKPYIVVNMGRPLDKNMFFSTSLGNS